MQYLLQAARYIFPLITIPYLTRILGPDTFAVRAYMISVMACFMVIIDYGFTPYGTKKIADALGTNEREDIECKMCGGITQLRLILCVLMTPILCVMMSFIPLMSENKLYVVIVFISTCFTALLPDFVFQGKEDMGIITHRFTLTQIFSIICIFCFVHSAQDLVLVAVFELASAVIAFIWSWGNVIIKQKITPKLTPLKELRPIFNTSTAFFISTAATTIIATLTTVVLGIVEEPTQVAYWSLAMTAVVAVQSLYTPLAQSLYPHMCARKDFSLAARLLKIGIPVGVIGSVLFACLSNIVFWLIGGEEYVAGSFVLVMLSPLFVFSFVSQILGYPVLAAVGHVKQLTESSVIAAGCNILLMVILLIISQFNLLTACVLRVVVEIILCISRIYFVSCWQKEQRISKTDK